MNTLIQKNMPLVIAIVNRFHPRNETERQDLIDAGRIGLWEGLQNFDPNQGCLSTYVYKPVCWAIIRELNKKNKRPKNISLDDIADPGVRIPDSLWEYYPSDMTNEEKTLIELRCAGYKFHEICGIVNTTPAIVKNRFYKALKKIKEGNDV